MYIIKYDSRDKKLYLISSVVSSILTIGLWMKYLDAVFYLRRLKKYGYEIRSCKYRRTACPDHLRCLGDKKLCKYFN